MENMPKNTCIPHRTTYFHSRTSGKYRIDCWTNLLQHINYKCYHLPTHNQTVISSTPLAFILITLPSPSRDNFTGCQRAPAPSLWLILHAYIAPPQAVHITSEEWFAVVSSPWHLRLASSSWKTSETCLGESLDLHIHTIEGISGKQCLACNIKHFHPLLPFPIIRRVILRAQCIKIEKSLPPRRQPPRMKWSDRRRICQVVPVSIGTVHRPQTRWVISQMVGWENSLWKCESTVTNLLQRELFQRRLCFFILRRGIASAANIANWSRCLICRHTHCPSTCPIDVLSLGREANCSPRRECTRLIISSYPHMLKYQHLRSPLLTKHGHWVA